MFEVIEFTCPDLKEGLSAKLNELIVPGIHFIQVLWHHYTQQTTNVEGVYGHTAYYTVGVIIRRYTPVQPFETTRRVPL